MNKKSLNDFHKRDNQTAISGTKTVINFLASKPAWIADFYSFLRPKAREATGKGFKNIFTTPEIRKPQS